MGWGNSILNNFWAKLISLILAIATWFYIFDLVNSDSVVQRTETVEDVFARYKFIMKEVPVKPVYFGRSPDGYRIDLDKVVIKPAMVAVFGPEDLIGEVNELRTDKINLGEYTRSAQIRLGLQSDTKFLQLQDKMVDVFLPVESVEQDKPTPNKTNLTGQE